LANLANEIATNKITKSRIKENIGIIESMRYPEILDAIKILKVVKNAYEESYLAYIGNQSVNEEKVNELFQQFFNTKTVEKILNCKNISLLEQLIANLSVVIKFSDKYNWLITRCKIDIILKTLSNSSMNRKEMENVIYNIERKRKKSRNYIIIDITIVVVLSILGLIVGDYIVNQKYYLGTEDLIVYGITGFSTGFFILTLLEWNKDNWNERILISVAIVSAITSIGGIVYSIWGWDAFKVIGYIIVFYGIVIAINYLNKLFQD